MQQITRPIVIAAGIVMCAALLFPDQKAFASNGYDAAMAQATERLANEQYRRARAGALDALRYADTPRQRAAAAEMLRQILTGFAAQEAHSPQERLTLILQVAGTHGLTGDFDTMTTQVQAALDQGAGLPEHERVKAVWDAAVFYVHLRENEVGRALDRHKEELHQRFYTRNTYDVRYTPRAPMGVGGWLHSPLLGDQAYREARFHQYPLSGEAYALVADMAAYRPLEELEDTTESERETSFYMVYDDAGWHMYIEVEEPDVQEIMMSGGRGGSSLELFFSPGLERVTYYQIMLRLGTGDVDFYHWASPYRGYRHLDQSVTGVRIETVPLEDRWAVSIFIPWRFFHDRLPFVQGKDNAWRFSLIRFGPVRTTWGGRVHETGRWGLIQWQPPSAHDQTGILRGLIRQAALKYQGTAREQAAFWGCEQRGDPVFFKESLEPVIKDYDQLAQEAQNVAQWSPQRVSEVFRDVVPVWMEFDYEVDELRSRYLMQRLLAGN